MPATLSILVLYTVHLRVTALARSSVVASILPTIVLVIVLTSSCSHSASGSTYRRVLSPPKSLWPAACQLLLCVVPHGQWALLDDFRFALIDRSTRTRGAFASFWLLLRLRQHSSWRVHHLREDVDVPRRPRQPCHGPFEHRPCFEQQFATVFHLQLPRELLSTVFLGSQLPHELLSAPPWPGLPRESQLEFGLKRLQPEMRLLLVTRCLNWHGTSHTRCCTSHWHVGSSTFALCVVIVTISPASWASFRVLHFGTITTARHNSTVTPRCLVHRNVLCCLCGRCPDGVGCLVWGTASSTLVSGLASTLPTFRKRSLTCCLNCTCTSHVRCTGCSVGSSTFAITSTMKCNGCSVGSSTFALCVVIGSISPASWASFVYSAAHRALAKRVWLDVLLVLCGDRTWSDSREGPHQSKFNYGQRFLWLWRIGFDDGGRIDDRHPHFLKRIRVEEQRAQRDNWIPRGSQIAYFTHATTERGAVEKGKGQNSYSERKTGECLQRKTIRYCSRRDTCSFPRETVRQRGKKWRTQEDLAQSKHPLQYRKWRNRRTWKAHTVLRPVLRVKLNNLVYEGKM